MGVHDQLCETKNLSTKVECISEPRLLSLLCSQCFNRLEIEIVIQVKIVQILAMNEQIQHVISLTKNLNRTQFKSDKRC